MHKEASGIVVVDKPAGITSAKVVATVKKLFNARKAGHTGTLDPFATGIMVCCINRATRLARFFLHGSKTYRAVLRLGIKTDTQDLTGTVTSTCEEVNFSETTIRSIFSQHSGVVEQLPPVYSALKHKGVPLYKLARKGEAVQKPARQVFISHIEVLEINLPEILFEVSCSAGTYIRTLCADIGTSLGCGGHLKALRRIENSGFSIDEAVTLPELKALSRSGRLPDSMIRMADALRGMPEYVADRELAEKIMFGNILAKEDFGEGWMNHSEGFIKVVDEHNNLIAVLNTENNGSKYKYFCVFDNNDRLQNPQDIL